MRVNFSEIAKSRKSYYEMERVWRKVNQGLSNTTSTLLKQSRNNNNRNSNSNYNFGDAASANLRHSSSMHIEDGPVYANVAHYNQGWGYINYVETSKCRKRRRKVKSRRNRYVWMHDFSNNNNEILRIFFPLWNLFISNLRIHSIRISRYICARWHGKSIQLNNRNIFRFDGDVLWFPCEHRIEAVSVVLSILCVHSGASADGAVVFVAICFLH